MRLAAPDHFPHVFGPDGDQPLDAEVVRERFAALAAEVGGTALRSPEDVAAGFLEIAVANMANAIKRISVARGYDVTGYTLQCFGGAGGQHACQVADALGMTRIFLHPFAGVLSAYGMGLADIRAIRHRTVEAKFEKILMSRLQKDIAELEFAAKAETYGMVVKKVYSPHATWAEVRDAAGHANVSITSAYLHVAVEDEGVGELFKF